MRADYLASELAVQMSRQAIPHVYWCPAAGALEETLRKAKGRGNLLQRIGLALALEALKTFRAGVWRMKPVRTTAKALRLRTAPKVDPSTDTGSVLLRGQVAQAHGHSFDGRWFYVVAPDGAGWASLAYLTDAEPERPDAGPLWYRIARAELGVRETTGTGTTARVREFHAVTTLKATDDETPWCSSFVNWCMQRAGIKGTGSAAARSWLTWGLALKRPVLGCVVVLKRGASPTSGHVAFYAGEGDDYLLLLGGNQGNAVKVSRYPRADVLGYRWPEGVPLPGGAA